MVKNPIQEIFLQHGEEFRKDNQLSVVQLKAMHAIECCGREEAGFHTYECPACHHTEIAYNSCRNRHCPDCQWLKQEIWIDRVKSQLLPVKYFHVIFTMPEFLNEFVMVNHELMYNILFEASWHALNRSVSVFSGVETGALSVLHTWGQNLSLHPHIHTLVPAGGLDEDGQQWIPCSKNFLLPVKSLSRIFRARVLYLMLGAFFDKRLIIPDTWKNKNPVPALTKLVKEKDWVVYAEKPKLSPAKVIKYLGKYIHRVAISNYRIESYDDEFVSFSCKDYADKGKRKSMKLSCREFIRRFLLHILPQRFCKVRYYGLFAIRNRKGKLGHCFILIDRIQLKPRFDGLSMAEILTLLTGKDRSICPSCGMAKMKLLKPP